MSTTPSIGRVVHYTSFGTPNGEYGMACRAAIITEIDDSDLGTTVGLAVFNPQGVFFDDYVEYDVHGETHGKAGGTWHWPERTE